MIVYKNVTLGYPPELADALRNRKIDAALHFSRRSAENYVNGAKAAGLEQWRWAPQPFLSVGAGRRTAASGRCRWPDHRRAGAERGGFACDLAAVT